MCWEDAAGLVLFGGGQAAPLGRKDGGRTMMILSIII